jgi:serine/threonine protein kinase/Tfp pilus assembly protein PilF
MIGKIVSHFKIISKLGEGGMGEVYIAEDTKLQRIVALKFLPPELTRDEQAQKRFVHEARTASALDHPNIGTIYEIGESDGKFFIAMAYYEGKTLKDKIESCQQGLNVEDAIDITIQIAQGLTRAHSKDIIHRDIKPANILMTKDGEVKIIDFGLAKLKGHTMLTKTGTTMGTVAYMSPEQTMGGVVDQRSDIWSLGVMLFEMLTGEQPFKGDYEQAIVYSIMNEQPEFITKIRSEVPLQIEKILERALVKNPEKRFQSMEEMLEELNIAAEEIKEGRSRKTSVFRLGRKQRKFAYQALVVILFAIALGIYFWQSKVAEAAPVSIALLPLESLTNETDQEWFTESMTDALITDLAKVRGLRVISRSSAMKYKGTNKTPPEIAAELNVQYIIEGSIVKMGDQVKISARLINALNDEYLWAEEYARGLSDILGLQGEIAQAIANKIQIGLTPQEKTLLAVTRSVNPETYELYLKGMYHIRKYTPDGIANGLKYLQQAVEKDPEEPLAHAGLALAYSLIAHTPSPPPGALLKSKEEGLKALELDKSLGETYLAVAMAQIYGDWDKEGAEKSYKRALELNPSLAEAYNQYAWYLLLIGKEDEAVKSLKQAQEVDPLTAAYPAWLGMLYFWLDRNDESKEEALKSLELVPNFPIALYALGSVYAAKGMFEEAIATLQKLGAISLDWKWGLGLTYALAGRREDALAVVAELESQPKVWYTWGLAEVYTALGDKDKAFYWLNEAYKQHHPYIQWIWRNPSLKPLRNDPRFTDLAQRLNVKI